MGILDASGALRLANMPDLQGPADVLHILQGLRGQRQKFGRPVSMSPVTKEPKAKQLQQEREQRELPMPDAEACDRQLLVLDEEVDSDTV